MSRYERLVNVENAITGAGADTVSGTGGANRLEGGAGNDTFRFTPVDGSVDRVADLGATDRAELRGLFSGYSSAQAGTFPAVRDSGSDLMLAVGTNDSAGGTAFLELALFDGPAGSSLNDLLGSHQLFVT